MKEMRGEQVVRMLAVVKLYNGWCRKVVWRVYRMVHWRGLTGLAEVVQRPHLCPLVMLEPPRTRHKVRLSLRFWSMLNRGRFPLSEDT